MRTELLWVYQGPIAAGKQKEVQDHSQGYWVWLLSKGSVRLQMGSKTWKAVAGQWVVSPQGRTLQEFSDDAQILSIHFRCQWPTGDNLFSGQDAEVWNAREFPKLQRSASSLASLVHLHFPRARLELVEKQISYDVFLRLEHRFLQWLADFHHAMERAGRTLAHAGSVDERILKAAKLLHESPLCDNFPSDQLQRQTALDRAHLDRLFWKSFGVTTRE
jgi:hypothetical protein